MNAPRRHAPPGWWYGDAPVPLGARALASVFGGVGALRRQAYRSGMLRRGHPGVPVVVVGNLVAGGSGKTPLVIAIAQRLQQEGWRVGIASRGHGRSDPNRPRWVEADSEAALVGDEPLLIARRTGARVRVDRDRLAAARALAGDGCQLVLCDDGLQHYRLRRDVEIEVLDARRRYGNARLMPAGPLREPLERAADCQFRVLNLGTGQVDAEPATGEWPMRLELRQTRPLQGGRPSPLERFSGQRVHAVAGIGDPERFFASVRSLGVVIVPHAFPDHHAYVAGDFEFASRLPILMTEKDAVKCERLGLPDAHVVAVDARLPEAFWLALQARLPARPGEAA